MTEEAATTPARPRFGAGVLAVLAGVFLLQAVISFFVDAGDAQDALRQLDAIDPNRLTSEKIGERFFTAGELAARIRLLLIAPLVIYGFLAAVMLGLWRFARRDALTALTLGACLYAATQVATVAVDASAILKGWPLRLVTIGLFWWGFRSTKDATTAERWQHLRPVVWFYGALIGAITVLGMWSKTTAGAFFAEPIAIGALVIVFLRRESTLHRPALDPKALRWHDPALAAGALLALGIFMKLWGAMLTSFGLPDLDSMKPLAEAGFGTVSIFLMLGLLPAVLEELAFRGIVFDLLRRTHLGTTGVVAVQALLFSALHLAPAAYVSHFVMGVTLGLLRLRSGTVYPGILVHLGWNAWVIAEALL